MLDRTANTAADAAEAAPPAEATPRATPAVRRRLRRLVNSIVKRWQFLVAQASSLRVSFGVLAAIAASVAIAALRLRLDPG